MRCGSCVWRVVSRKRCSGRQFNLSLDGEEAAAPLDSTRRAGRPCTGRFYWPGNKNRWEGFPPRTTGGWDRSELPCCFLFWSQGPNVAKYRGAWHPVPGRCTGLCSRTCQDKGGHRSMWPKCGGLAPVFGAQSFGLASGRFCCVSPPIIGKQGRRAFVALPALPPAC